VDPLKPGDPRQIGDYLLSGRLGAGGMGEVFFGRSPGGRAVAVKLINPLYANDAEFRRRFDHEIEACRKVGGFHTAHVVDADPSADRPWMVTAYVAGPGLNKVLATYSALPPHSLRVLGAGLAEALVAIHAAGIIHRDLKPSNILLADDGPIVIDFGIARAVDASSITAQHGTPGFMAPEVLQKESVTSACDVFALGVVLAFAGGVRPFGKGPARAIDYRVVHEEPDLQGLDPNIRGLVAECLARNPDDRPVPANILERLAEHDSLARWLPEPIHDMVTACLPPREPTVVDVRPPEYSRLLGEAEQIARALPDRYERASALLHIATVACRVDPPHAARLIDDAWRGPLVEYLIESSPIEVGTAMGCSDPLLGGQMLADITEYSRVHTHRHMGIEEETAGIITMIAEAAASVDPARAEQTAHLLTDESLWAKAVARVAMVAAHTDPARAEQMTRSITSRIEQEMQTGAVQSGTARITRWRRKRPRVPHAVSFAGPRLGDETARYWAAQALAEVALRVAGVGPIRLGRSSTDAAQFARTITMDHAPHLGASVSGRTAAGIDRTRATQHLIDAEQLAMGIAASGLTASGVGTGDLRAAALTAVKTAAARIDSGHADALLTEAEQAARAISTDSERFKSLERVALTAARIDPGRAEQIARSLPPRPPELGELALMVAFRDPGRAERIAVTITDEYVRALVRAVLTIQTAPGNAGALLEEAENAAGEIPAHLIAVAMVTARLDRIRAERIVRTIKSGPEIMYAQSEDNQFEWSATTGYMRSAEYWRARALAELAVVSYERNRDQDLAWRSGRPLD